MNTKQFVERVKYAHKNAKRAKALLKKQGYVLLPDGSVHVDPKRRRSLESYGLKVVSIKDDDGVVDLGVDDDEDFEDEFAEDLDPDDVPSYRASSYRRPGPPPPPPFPGGFSGPPPVGFVPDFNSPEALRAKEDARRAVQRGRGE